MQEEKIGALEFYCEDKESFINDLFNQQERKQEPNQSENSGKEKVESCKNTQRGKGRPKGEKNSKESTKKNKSTIPSENLRRGHWTIEENKRYHWFLEIYHNHFIKREMRRLDKIFKTMATFIGTRQAEQCRSHHQKMEKKYNAFSNILLFLRQSHYGTHETYPILQEMNKCQIKENGILLDSNYLQQLDSPKQSTTNVPFLQEYKEQSMMEINKFLDLGEGNNFNSFQDMLGDNYELHLDLDNLLI